MVKLKKYRVHKAICNVCNGNGFVKITDEEDPKEVNVHQCWECGSEGEYYVHEPETIQPNNYVNPVTSNDVKLH
jgi:DnaJ-class molecular chaperone